MAAAEEDGGHGGSEDDEEALDRGDDFYAGPQGRESEGPDQRRRVSENQTAGMVAPAAGAATPTAQLLAAAAGGDSAVVTTDGFGAGQTNVETPSSVGPVGWEIETKPLDEIQQEKLVRTLEDADDCLKRVSSEFRLLESSVVSEGAVADELNKKLLCISTLLDHIMGTALNSSESPLRSTVFEKSTQLSTELDRLSSIMDSHQRSRDSAVEDRAGFGAGSHDTYHADAQGVTQPPPTTAAAEAKVDTVDAVELAAKEAEAEAEAAEAEAEEAEAEAAEAAEAAERAEAVAVAASSERVALGPSTEASAMEVAQLLLQALSGLAATGDIGDSAGEAFETKNGGGADAASVHDGTLFNKILPERYRKEYLAEKARNRWRKMAVQSRKMAVSSVKKVSTSSIPSTSELVALGPSTAASAQQAPSAAASSLPRNGLAAKRDREPLQDQVAQTQDCCMKSSKQRKITYDMFNRNSDGATMNHLGISGSISFSGVEKMFDKVPPGGHLFFDLGVGHGRMIALAMESGAYSAAGIELKENMLSCHPLFESVMQGAGINPFSVNIRYGDISELQGLGPATYVFSFWNSMSLQTRMAILLLLSESPTARVFACSNIPGKESIQGVLTELNKHSGSAPWDLCDQFKTTVLGNAMSSEIWIFKRNPEQTLREMMALTGKIHSFLTFDSDLWRVMRLSNPKVRTRNDSQNLTRVHLNFWKIGEFLTKQGIRVLKRLPNRADGSGPIVRVVKNGVIRELLISSDLHSDDSADAGMEVFEAIIPPISEGGANPLDVNLRASAFAVSSCAGQFSQPANSAAATGREFGEEEENTSANCCVGSRGSCSPGANKSKSAADGLYSLRESDYLLKEVSESVLMFQGDIDRSVFKRLREVLRNGNAEMNICGLVKKDVLTVLGTTWFNDEVITWALKRVCSTVTGGEFADFDTFFGVFLKGGKPTIVFNSLWLGNFLKNDVLNVVELKRWLQEKNVPWKQIEIFHFAVNRGNSHWFLASACKQDLKVIIRDSLRAYPFEREDFYLKVFRVILAIVSEATKLAGVDAGHHVDASLWRLKVCRDHPQQDDDYSCGPATVHSVYAQITGMKTKIGPADFVSYRKHFAQILLDFVPVCANSGHAGEKSASRKTERCEQLEVVGAGTKAASCDARHVDSEPQEGKVVETGMNEVSKISELQFTRKVGAKKHPPDLSILCNPVPHGHVDGILEIDCTCGSGTKTSKHTISADVHSVQGYGSCLLICIAMSCVEANQSEDFKDNLKRLEDPELVKNWIELCRCSQEVTGPRPDWKCSSLRRLFAKYMITNLDIFIEEFAKRDKITRRQLTPRQMSILYTGLRKEIQDEKGIHVPINEDLGPDQFHVATWAVAFLSDKMWCEEWFVNVFVHFLKNRIAICQLRVSKEFPNVAKYLSVHLSQDVKIAFLVLHYDSVDPGEWANTNHFDAVKGAIFFLDNEKERERTRKTTIDAYFPASAKVPGPEVTNDPAHGPHDDMPRLSSKALNDNSQIQTEKQVVLNDNSRLQSETQVCENRRYIVEQGKKWAKRLASIRKTDIPKKKI